MKSRRKVWVWSVRVSLLALAVFALAISFATPARAQSFTQLNPPPFDFSEGFYFDNGFNMSKFSTFGARVGNDQRDASGCAALGISNKCDEFGSIAPPGQGHWATDNSNTDPTRSHTRVLQTTGGFDADGDLIYYS